ncbi:MAG: fatty acid desaturase [Planctomycetaceae bacterium]|nr:fatty acid desaturase [Planctomycetaceae bacterium]
MRTDKEILLATRPFAREVRWRSWWHLGSTVFVAAALLGIASYDALGALRFVFGVLAGLTLVRLFVLFHDHQHGSILRGSKLADGVMTAFGIWSLNPPSVWKRSHDHHHHNNSKLYGPNVGSYPIMTVDAYARASRRERMLYAASRHPVTIATGYLTIFLVGMCVAPLIANPRRHADAVLSIACHAGFLLWLATGGADDMWLAGVLPFAVGSGVGAYLFFAQHNFPGAHINAGKDWTYVSAALRSSSYVSMGPLMRWFTGSIGYHHVHHLNSHIPFYRLAEAMAAIPEAQSPTTVTLGFRDVASCLRLKLWDADAERLVPWPAKSGIMERPLRAAA